MGRFLNHYDQAPVRRMLRKSLTGPEIFLWSKIQNKQLGYKFRRQTSIGKYVADFYCPQAKIVIEIDGDSHSGKRAEEYDQMREQFMQAVGVRTVRFTNEEVMKNIGGVLEKILEILGQSAPPLAPPR